MRMRGMPARGRNDQVGSPHFAHADRLLCSMAAFKQRVAFGFRLGNPVAGTGKDAQLTG